MRKAFAHEALLAMDPDGDTAAPGAAVTVELCGHWGHEPPCPIAPHHSAIERTDDRHVQMRVLFATEPAEENEVRRRIGQALRAGELTGPEGHSTSWRLVDSAASVVLPAEAEHAQRLTQS